MHLVRVSRRGDVEGAVLVLLARNRKGKPKVDFRLRHGLAHKLRGPSAEGADPCNDLEADVVAVLPSPGQRLCLHV